MSRVVLGAVAKLHHVDVGSAAAVVRKNPILGEEIDIEEELINLEEAFGMAWVAEESLKQYPSMRYHIEQERRLILKHCIGLISRMLEGDRHTEDRTIKALKKLVRLVMADVRHTGKKVSSDTMAVFHACLPWYKRFTLRTGIFFRSIRLKHLIRVS